MKIIIQVRTKSISTLRFVYNYIYNFTNLDDKESKETH